MLNYSTSSRAFLRDLAERSARTAVSSSSARNMGRAGLIQTARNYLTVSVKPSDLARNKRYNVFFDHRTAGMQRAIRRYLRNGTGWGPSRKFLNIYIRDLFYNYYLRREYDLSHIEAKLEIPLDSYVVGHIRKETGRNHGLPRWQGVISLDADLSEKYQFYADQIARKCNTRRVHLDVAFWNKP